MGDGRRGQDPGFRRARARLAAYAMHARHPGAAREAGRRGGEATAGSFPLGRSAWGVAMALRRWHGTPLQFGGRAPSAGSGGDRGGAREPGPAPARSDAERGRKR
jgi:hypothetical protein